MQTIDNNNAILTARDLKTYFPVKKGFWGKKQYVRAVDGVDLVVRRGKTLGLVGESGSGKTTVGRTLLKLIPATAGEVIFEGLYINRMAGGELRNLRQKMQIIFQDPVGSLNPRMTVGSIVSEPMVVHFSMTRRERRERVASLLERVGLSSSYINRYPHEFSGGQRQRIGIARALASNPSFIVCDEPVSALDVSIQAQILNLLQDLQDEYGISYLFIAHNLAVVEHFASEVAVMYLGRIVEIADRDDLYKNPTHPYTKALLASVPVPDPTAIPDRTRLAGEVPSPINPPTGCTFHPRCPYSRKMAENLPESDTATILSDGSPVRIVKRCTTEIPHLKPNTEDPTHLNACLLCQGSGK